MSYNPDRINIHELTVEEPEKQEGLPFDPERDITEQDWRGMRSILESWKHNDWQSFSAQAMEMKIIDPTQNLNLDQDDWQGMTGCLASLRDDQRFDSLAVLVMGMKILGPEKDIGIQQDDWGAIRELLERNRGSNWWYFSFLAIRMKFVNPTKDLNINEEAWQGMDRQLEMYKEIHQYDSFAKQAMNIKLLSCKKEIKIDRSTWQGIKDLLKEYEREGNWSDFSSIASAIKILAAEKVEVTDKGLEITMPKPKKDLKPRAQPLPEVKQF